MIESQDYRGLGVWMNEILITLENETMTKARELSEDEPYITEKRRKRDEENKERMKKRREKAKEKAMKEKEL